MSWDLFTSAEAAVPEADTLRTRLEEIVARLEEEALELGESLALFEEGVRPLRVTQGILDRTEARVQQLLQDGEGFRLDDWEEP